MSDAKVRPLTRTVLNSGPKPRTVTKRPSPPWRSIDTPGMRCSDSATLESGNLPSASELTASTIEFDSRLMLIAWSKLPRIPVTTIASICCSDGSLLAASCAMAEPASTIPSATRLLPSVRTFVAGLQLEENLCVIMRHSPRPLICKGKAPALTTLCRPVKPVI